MFQQTRSSRPAAKLTTVSGHHPTGGVLEVDLSLHGSIRSAGTWEYRWLMLSSWQRTDRFGDKSQRRDATADRSASWRSIAMVCVKNYKTVSEFVKVMPRILWPLFFWKRYILCKNLTFTLAFGNRKGIEHVKGVYTKTAHKFRYAQNGRCKRPTATFKTGH